MSENEFTGNHESGLTLQELVALLWEGKLVLLAALAAALLVAGAYLWMATPVFQVDAMVQVEEKSGGTNAMLGDLGSFFDVASPAVAEIAIIKSRMVLGKVVRDLQLDVACKPKTFPLIGDVLLRYRGLAPRLELGRFSVGKDWEEYPFELEVVGEAEYALWDKGNIVMAGFVGEPATTIWGNDTLHLFVRAVHAMPGQRFLLWKIPYLDRVEKLEEELYVAEEQEKSGIIALALQSPDAQQASTILNAVAFAYVQQNVDRKSAEASKTLEFLRGQIPELQAKSEAAETKLNEYRLKVGSIDLNAESQLVLNQGVDLEAKILLLQQQRSDLLRLYKKDHSTVRTLDKQIGQLYHEKGNVTGAVKKLPKTQQEILRLTQEAKVSSEVYNNVLNSAQQLEVAKAGQVGNVRIIDYALPRRKPISPDTFTTIIVLALAGLAVGVGVIMVRRFWARGVEDPKELERNLGLPVYAVIPHSEAQRKMRKGNFVPENSLSMLSDFAPEDLAVEAFRSLRTTLHFSMHDAPNNVLLMVGPSPDIGKSFVTSNLAGVMAQSGKRICLVDADLRRGGLHRIFHQGREPGFSDYLSHTAELGDIVRYGTDSNLAYVSTGLIPPNPSELLLGARTEEFIQEISASFDLVIVDSPPLLAVADAMILAKLAGSTLMVLRHGKHRMIEIEQALARLGHAGVKVKGCIFNDVQALAGGGYGYGARYGYVYQYRYATAESRA